MARFKNRRAGLGLEAALGTATPIALGYPHSSSKMLASQVEDECFETRFSDLARGLFRRKPNALTPKRGAIF